MMKTNQNLIRKMGNFDIIQRTSDGMFNGNDLLMQWNSQPSVARRKMSEFLNSPKTTELIEAIINEESKCRNCDFLENQIIIKGKSQTLKNGKKLPASVWMHPYLFIDFAMWLNPTFRVKVLKFVYDQLIKYRNDAGDEYMPMAKAVAKISPKDQIKYSITKVATAINYIVYNEHYPEIRNKRADEKSLHELSELERLIAKLINDGFINSHDALMKYLRKKWQEKYLPKIMVA